MATISKREQILTLLGAFIRQRPGLEYGNYCSDWRDTEGRKAYFSEMRSITKDRHIAEKLLAQVAWRKGIGEEQLRDAFRAFSGRLSIVDLPDGKMRLDYCTGQYFPTEYRKAVCAVLAQALWDYFRDQCMPDAAVPELERYRSPMGKGYVSAGDWIRQTARREFGASIQRKYFD